MAHISHSKDSSNPRDERFRREPIRKGDIELADFHGRSRERSFQRPFGESREVPRGEINPRTESEGRSKEYNCA